MPISLSNHQFAPPMPEMRRRVRDIGGLSAWADNERHSKSGVGRQLARALNAVLNAGRRRAVINELSSLSDRELADIGLTRYDISRVFDPGFAAEYNARR